MEAPTQVGPDPSGHPPPEVMTPPESTAVVVPVVAPATPAIALAVVASAVDVAIARVEKIHKPTSADKLQG
eukprot:996323-Heterocapsa_arctica.AAC.1